MRIVGAIFVLGVIGIVAGCAVEGEEEEEAVASSEEALGKWNTAQPGRDCLQGDGTYCGGAGVKGASDALYECSAGRYRRIETCSKSNKICQRRPGTTDRCAVADGEASGLGIGGYAGSCAGRGLGAKYCGQHLISFGDANKLYECRSDGNGYLVDVCGSGCQPVDGPTNDYCKSGGGTSSSDSFPRMTAARVKAIENVNLRSGPGTGFGIITVIPAGTYVNLGDVGNGMVTTNGYWPVYYGSSRGWAARAYLQ